MLKQVKLVLISVSAFFAVFWFGHDYFSRYKSWRALSQGHISDAAQWYITNRAFDPSGITAICLYALSCDEDRAHLVMVSDLDQYDFEKLKQQIWMRRFQGVCQGRTANLGLHFLRSHDNHVVRSSDHAIWSFYNDKFIPTQGHWNIAGAFSEESVKRCSIDTATFIIEQGVLVKNAN